MTNQSKATGFTAIWENKFVKWGLIALFLIFVTRIAVKNIDSILEDAREKKSRQAEVKNSNLTYFSVYCFVVGIAAIIYSLV